ncbi:MAG: glycosyltransferase family 39 protein [Clostridia bacterium]|nr:glycosyltransferase family 39 protein [Clostridia bacterium]
MQMQGKEKIKTLLGKSGWILYLAAISVVIALFAFGGSPFYPINEWSDPNCFLTVGRAMLDGKVMYRDIYEQKGPFVYFLHAIAALISGDSFLGVWIFEIINLFFVLLLLTKIVGLYGYSRRICLFVATMVSLSACFSYAMSTGDSVEEFVAPLYLWLLYVTVKNIKENAKFTIGQYFFIGLTSGIVFWSKFTVVGIYVGWFAYFIWRSVRRKESKEIGKAIGWIACGVLVATLPCLAYFLATGAVRDWLQVYLYDNLFLYSAEGNILQTFGNMVKNICVSLVRNPQYNLFALFGILWFIVKKHGEERWFLLWIFSLLTVVLFVGGRNYRYYGLPFYVFAVFGYVALLECVGGKLINIWKPASAAFCAVMIGASVGFFYQNGHDHYIFREKEDTLFYQVAEYIEEHGDGTPTLLNYGGLDNGFYLAAEQVPKFRFFAELNIPMEEMKEEMEEYLDEKQADFVIIKNWQNLEEPIDHPNYEEVLRMEEWSRNEEVEYVLYQVVEE